MGLIKINFQYQNMNNHIQNDHLGKYILRYMVRNNVLRLHSKVTVKLNFQLYISDDIPFQMEILTVFL